MLDTGYTDHRDLVANIVPGYDFISYYGQTTKRRLYPTSPATATAAITMRTIRATGPTAA